MDPYSCGFSVRPFRWLLLHCFLSQNVFHKDEGKTNDATGRYATNKGPFRDISPRFGVEWLSQLEQGPFVVTYILPSRMFFRLVKLISISFASTFSILNKSIMFAG